MLLRHARVDADRPVVRLRVVARALERLPGRLQKDALLRVGDLGLARAHPEELRSNSSTSSRIPRART